MSDPTADHAEVTAAQPIGTGPKLAESSLDKIAKSQELKDEGNTAFKAGNYRTAIKKYHHALMYTKAVVDQGDLSVLPGLEQVVKRRATDEEKAAAKELTTTISNNLAACFVNTEKWEKAFEYSNKVLQVQPDNAKALFRRGRACIHLNKVVEAKSDLKRALEINPDSTGIKKELAVLEKKTRELELKEQKLYSTMLGNQS